MAPDVDVSCSPAKKETSVLPGTTGSEQRLQTHHDAINTHDHELTDPGNGGAVLPPQVLTESVEETAPSEESTSSPAPSIPVRVLRSRSISVPPPNNTRSRPKKDKGGPAEEVPALPHIPEGPPLSANEPGTPNGQVGERRTGNTRRQGVHLDHRPIRGRGPTLRSPPSSSGTRIEFEDGSATEDDEADNTIQKPTDRRGNTDDEEEVEIALSQIQPADTADEDSPVMEAAPIAAVDDETEENEAAYDTRRTPTTADQPTADWQTGTEYYDLSSSPQRPLTSPLPSPQASAVSVDFSPAKGDRGAATQAIIEERERALRIGRRALASRGPRSGELLPTSGLHPPIFKGKARARTPDDIGFGASYESIHREADHNIPPVMRSPPRARARPATGTSNNHHAPHNVRPEGEDALYRDAARLPINPRSPYPTSNISHTFDEDSDRHFAGLDSIMARALRVLCKRYRFSAMDVRQKFELRNQDLASTKKVLEENRLILDSDSAFQDFSQ